MEPLDVWLFADVWQLSTHLGGKQSLGSHKVENTQRFVSAQQLVGVWPDHVGDLGENANDFAGNLGLSFTNAVIGLDNFFRLDEHRFSRCRLVVNDATHFALVFADGFAGYYAASSSLGVRPAFAIKA